MLKRGLEGATVMEPKACVLVTDGQERAALAITRGLGQAGIPVIVGAETGRSLASTPGAVYFQSG
jgi:hypothetical protein